MKRYLIITFFFYLALPVLAQTDSLWNKDLKEITVVAERAELYNTGGRTDKPDSLLQNVFKSSTLAGLLDASNGIVIRSYGPGILASSSLRGGNAQQTALTWNGMSINSPVNGLTDFNLVPSFLFDGMSVLPGLAGSLQGSGAISGGINLNTVPSKQKGFSLEWLQTMASFGTYTGGLKLFYTGNKWSHATKGFFSKTNNNYPFSNYAVAGNPKQNLTNAEGVNYAVLHETAYETPKAGKLKFSYWGTFANRQIPPTMVMESSNALQVDNIHKTMFQWDKAFKKMSVKFHSVLQNDYLKYAEPEIEINSVSKSYFITNDAEFRFKLIKNSTTSAGVVQSFAKAKVNNISTNDTSILNQSQRSQVAFWASHFQMFPKIRTQVSLGIREEIVDNKPLPIIPSLGFKTKLHKNLDIYGQANRVYRIPTLNDLHWFPGGNPELKPESGWGFELTTDFHKKNRKVDFTTSLTGYSRLITNWIQWQPVNSTLWSPVNIGKVNSLGLEFRSSFKLVISKKMYNKLGLTFDYTKSENADAGNPNFHKQLLYVPFYKSSGFIGFGFNKTLLLVSGVWVGKRFVSTDNLDSITAYGLLNMAINQTLTIKKASMNLFVRVNNILDNRYEAIVWRPMPGINYEFGVIVCLNR